MLIKSMVDRMFGLGLFKRPPTATNPEQARGLETQFNSELLPDRNLQVTYVVPIRGEVASGNFFLQLKDFARQRGMSTDVYEVIYAINNKPKDISTQNQYYKENQTIFDVIQYIQGVREYIPEGLEEWQQHIVQRAKHKKLRLVALNIHPGAMTDNNVESNIETARSLGESYAVQRFQSIQTDGALVLMDADTRIQADTTRLIKEQLVDQPEVGLLKIAYDYVPGEGGEKIYKTAPERRFLHNAVVLANTIRGWHVGGWYAVKANSFGGHATLSQRDDLRPTKGNIKLASGIRFYTQDRARPQTVGGRFGSDRLERLKDNSAHEQLRRPALSFLIDLYEGNRNNQHVQEEVSEILHAHLSEEVWSQLNEKIKRGESIQSDNLIWNASREPKNKVSAKDYANEAYDIFRKLSGDSEERFQAYVTAVMNQERFRHNHTIATVKRLLNQTYSSSSNARDLRNQDSEDRQTLEAHFLRQNSWIGDEIKHAKRKYKNAEDAFLALQNEFPEYLRTFEDTSYTYPNAIVLGITRFIENVRLHPHEFPEIASLINH